MRQIDDVNFVVFDIETGGLDENRHSIIEFAFISLESDKKTGDLKISEDLTFDCLVKPYNNNLTIEDEALSISGLSFDKIEEFGLESLEVLEGLIELSEVLRNKSTKKHNFKPILVGHNIDNFDIPFLIKFFEVHGKNLYDYFDKSTIDTYTLSRLIFRKDFKIDNLKLATVCNYFGIQIANQHRAYNDALANAQLFIKIDKILNLKRKEILQL